MQQESYSESYTSLYMCKGNPGFRYVRVISPSITLVYIEARNNLFTCWSGTNIPHCISKST